eukprot:tig00020556_g11046.t1
MARMAPHEHQIAAAVKHEVKQEAALLAAPEATPATDRCHRGSTPATDRQGRVLDLTSPSAAAAGLEVAKVKRDLSALKKEKQEVEDSDDDDLLKPDANPFAKRAKPEVAWALRELAPGVGVHPDLAKSLKPHQLEGARFLWRACVTQADELQAEVEAEYQKRLQRAAYRPNWKPKKRAAICGGILAHCMGLGKTLTTIAFLHTRFMAEKEAGRPLPCFLLVVPVNTLQNWAAELERWIPASARVMLVHEVPQGPGVALEDVADRLETWRRLGGALLVGYERLRGLILTEEHRNLVKETGRAQCRGAQRANDEAVLKEMRKRAERLGIHFSEDDDELRGQVLRSMKERFKPKANRKFNAARAQIAQDRLDRPGQETARRVRDALCRAEGQRCPLDVVVLDEGHRLKAAETQLAVAVGLVEARRRAVLTGYPLQNNLWEYYHMLNFVRPGALGPVESFFDSFVWPIDQGTWKDSSEEEVKRMYERLFVLHEQVAPFMDRKDARVLTETLSSHNRSRAKHEFIVQVRMSPEGERLYERLIAAVKAGRLLLPKKGKGEEQEQGREQREGEAEGGPEAERTRPNVLVTRSVAMKIFNSPEVLRRFLAKLQEDKAAGLVVDENIEDDESAEGDGPAKRVVRVDYGAFVEASFASRAPFGLADAPKLAAAMEIARLAAERRDKVLLFSGCKTTLRLAEEFAVSHLGYKRGEQVFYMDGSTPAGERQKAVTDFNKRPGARLFVISTVAGGIGINLVAANRVIIMDACWNPCHDTQALFRAYRYGQFKDVFVYRFVAAGTLEARVYTQQVVKQSLFRRTVDVQTVSRHIARQDVGDYLAVPLEWRYPSGYADVVVKDPVLQAVVDTFAGPKKSGEGAEGGLGEEEEDEEAPSLVEQLAGRPRRLRRGAGGAGEQRRAPEGMLLTMVHEHESLLADDDPGGRLSEQDREAAREEAREARRRRRAVVDSEDEGAGEGGGEGEEGVDGAAPASSSGGPPPHFSTSVPPFEFWQK